MNKTTDTAFILAAGKGTRMQPLTDKLPKPMVPIAGKPTIGHIVDHLIAADIQKIIVNLYYKGDVIKDFLTSTYPNTNIIFSEETELLDTGGGVKNALHHITDDAFFLINGDAFWLNEKENVFKILSNHWHPDEMDMILLLQTVSQMTLTHGIGDYNIDQENRAIRNLDKNGDYMFAGIRLLNKSLFNNTPEGTFSFLTLMDQAQKNKKLYGHVFQGNWHHISTPNDLNNVNQAIAQGIKND